MNFFIGCIIYSIALVICPFFWCSFTKFNYFVSLRALPLALANLIINCIIHGALFYVFYAFFPDFLGWLIGGYIFGFFFCL